MQRDVALLLGEGDELAPVGATETLLDRVVEHAPHRGGHRRRHAEFLARGHDEAGVLGRQRQSELRRSAAAVDRLDLTVDEEVGRAGRAQDLHGVAHLDPRLGGERQSLEADPGGRERDEAVEQLHGVPETQLTDVEGGAPQRLEHRQDARRPARPRPPP